MVREKAIDLKYIGMLPPSLELNQLIKSGLKYSVKKENGKCLSTDIINVKFNQKVASGKTILKHISNKLLGELDEGYKNKLNDFMSTIEAEASLPKWDEISSEQLRIKLYTDGFVLNGTHYKVYKRSSSKSRVGQCLFIKEKLYDRMMRWSRLGLNFDVQKQIDYPSLLAYESLVGSAIEKTIKIDPKNILIVNDVESRFVQRSNVIRTSKNGFLNSFEEDAWITNSLFDGESLLDSSYFDEGKSMLLLRNHMFKSAAFNCNIQLFLKEHCPPYINYEEWEIPSMFDGIKLLAKDVHFIITPSSLKALKFSSLIGTEQSLWEHWKKVIYADDCIFGICKNEKKSKQGYDESGHILQQTSYQMINSLPISQTDMSDLCQYEKDVITRLKNNDDDFISHIRNSANEMNSHSMFADLFLHNKDLAKTKLFRRFRKDVIHSHVNHIKNGKIRLRGDYCVLLGNPIEFLFHSIGRLITDQQQPESLSLKNNEVHTKLFDYKELTAFRNPHTSPSNVLIVQNTPNLDIEKYFNLSPNIVCVNAIQFPLQDILSGCDYDSDTVLLIDNERLLSISQRVFGKYRVCVNLVASNKKKYQITSYDMAVIDNELSKSQRYIGRTVNIGQLCMSTYWHLLNIGAPNEQLISLLKKIDVVTVLSGICIDLAKKMFTINIGQEIRYISETRELIKEKPLFWKYVSQNDSIQSVAYQCPMDYLYNEMTALKMADYRKSTELSSLLLHQELRKADRKQLAKIVEYIETMCMSINQAFAASLPADERDRIIDDFIRYYQFYIGKLKINPNTMYSLLEKIARDEQRAKIATKLMNVLYRTHKEMFIAAFKSKVPH
ncbi:hypothetical protein [Paenibacillus sp. 1011MAR3C5]|uniref:hypothetical protein n=1 Tax=Paenibacillus sp. 1011MAR3C5 TaxID=1675787 RepID=UPI002175C8F9|nr:hypothetical protein [Paenibacillus sp. 1011MAR3C5]